MSYANIEWQISYVVAMEALKFAPIFEVPLRRPEFRCSLSVAVSWFSWWSQHSLKMGHSESSIRTTAVPTPLDLPRGNSFGLTSSRKKSWATWACTSPSCSQSRNQKRILRDSCECWPVLALTRKTRNSRLSCAGLRSAFWPARRIVQIKKK